MHFIYVLAPILTTGVMAQSWSRLENDHLSLEAARVNDAAFADFDGDGDLDLVTVSPDSFRRLYFNDGQGGFTDASAGLPAFPPPHVTSRVAVGDIDGDGDSDILFSGFGPAFALARNRGDGTFDDASSNIPSLFVANFTRFTDGDGDGDLDVVFVSGSSRIFLRNDGTGSFVDASVGRFPHNFESTQDIVVADVDGDGDEDLFLPQYATVGRAPNRLYLNVGGVSYVDASSRLPPRARAGTHAQVADFNRDGVPDLLILNPFGSIGRRLQVLLNDGTGAYRMLPTAGLPQQALMEAAFAHDLDADGDADVLVSTADSTSVWINDGSGQFQPDAAGRLPSNLGFTERLITGDVDGDGDQDVLLTNLRFSRLLFARGSGFYSDGVGHNVPYGRLLTMAHVFIDVDGDGTLELATGGTDGVRIFDNVDRQGQFSRREHLVTSPLAEPRDLCFVDVNSDDAPDLVVANGLHVAQQDQLFLNVGGRFIEATSRLPQVPDRSFEVRGADVDGDGQPDLVFLVGTNPAVIKIWLNRGPAGFVPGNAVPSAAGFGEALAAGDVDRDGDIDLLVGNRLLLNNGAGRFRLESSTRFPVPTISFDEGLFVDVDADGDLDLFLGSFDGDQLFLNRGDGSFRDATAGRLPALGRWSADIAAGDVDGDGDVDLASRSFQQTRLYRNDGTGHFVDVSASVPDSLGGCCVWGLADVDGDDDVDLINTGVVFRNLLQQLDTPRLPILGGPFPIRIWSDFPGASLPTVGLAILSSRQIQSRIPGLGTLYVDPAVSIVLAPRLLSPNQTTFPLVVPTDSRLLGGQFFVQGLVSDLATRSALTNFTVERFL